AGAPRKAGVRVPAAVGRLEPPARGRVARQGPPRRDMGRGLRRSEQEDHDRWDDPGRARQDTPGLDRHLSHQRQGSQDRRGAPHDHRRPPPAGLPLRSAVGALEVTIARARPAVARAQAEWIAAIEPWRGLGYQAAPLGRYLARMAAAGDAWAATEGRRGKPLGVVVATDGFLLGGFIALLAVRPE